MLTRLQLLCFVGGFACTQHVSQNKYEKFGFFKKATLSISVDKYRGGAISEMSVADYYQTAATA